MKVKVDRPYTIQCIGIDALRRERISIFYLKQSCHILSFTAEPVSIENTDLIILPPRCLSSAFTTIPRIAYGVASDLNFCYLNGCDDFLREPWEPEEMYWRTERLLKGLILDFCWGKILVFPDHAVSSFGNTELTFHEYRLLSILSRFRGEAVCRETLFMHLPGTAGPGSRAVDMHVSMLRKKIRLLTPPMFPQNIIRSIRNYGYMIP